MTKHQSFGWVSLLCAFGLLLPAVALAYAPEPDLMKTKGYSPEVLNAAQTQRSRQEWRVPESPRRSPMEQFLHNIYYNDWVGGMDEFGSQTIRYRQ